MVLFYYYPPCLFVLKMYCVLQVCRILWLICFVYKPTFDFCWGFFFASILLNKHFENELWRGRKSGYVPYSQKLVGGAAWKCHPPRVVVAWFYHMREPRVGSCSWLNVGRRKLMQRSCFKPWKVNWTLNKYNWIKPQSENSDKRLLFTVKQNFKRLMGPLINRWHKRACK